MIQCKMLCRKHMFLLTTVAQKAVSRGLHIPGGAVELGGPTTSKALMSKVYSLFLLVYLSGAKITTSFIITWISFLRYLLMPRTRGQPWIFWFSFILSHKQCLRPLGYSSPSILRWFRTWVFSQK